MTYTATYSPEDNKLRLYSSTRLDRELYARVRGAGFIYAPKQELFVAPMWTPEREDLLIELCGEIDDEDPSWHLWCFVKGGVIGLCPLPSTSLFQLTAKVETIGADIEGVVRKATGHRIGRVAWSSIYQPAVRMVDRYRVGRVFLAGDAAHVTRRQVDKASTPACRMLTIWAGSSRTSCAADLRLYSTPTNPNAFPSLQPYSV